MKNLSFLIAFSALTLTTPFTAQAEPWSIITVDENGAPIAGASIRIGRYDSEPATVTTGANGRASGDLKPYGGKRRELASVSVAATGYAPSGGDLLPGENRFVLTPPRTVSGRVVDEKGQPVPNVQVTLRFILGILLDGVKGRDAKYGKVSPNASERELFSARTDAGGRYTIGNLPRQGRALFTIREMNWDSDQISVELGKDEPVRDLIAKPAAIVKGRVLEANGQPAKNKLVVAGSLYLNAVYTDDEGRYTLGGLSGKPWIRVSPQPATDTAVAPPVVVETDLKAPVQAPDIRLGPGGLLDIELTPRLSEGLVSIVSYQAGFTLPVIPIREGRIRARLTPGKYYVAFQDIPRLWAKPEQWNEGRWEFEIREGKTTKATFAYVPELPLKGTARDENGNLALGATIMCYPDGPKGYTSSTGNFFIQHLKPGEVLLQGDGRWSVVKPLRVQIPAAEPIEVTMRRVEYASVRGRIVDEAGKPISGEPVHLKVELKNVDGTTSTDYKRCDSYANGSYDISGVRLDARIAIEMHEFGQYRIVRGGEFTIERPKPPADPQFADQARGTIRVSDIVVQKKPPRTGE